MRTRIVSSILCLAFVLGAAPAQAQYGVSGPSNRATGETYKFEFSAYLWNPTPDLAIRSEWRGIVGDRIDLVEDLGLEKTRFAQIRAVLRPATKHKLRFEFTPIHYEQPEGLLTPRRDLQRAALQPVVAGRDDAEVERLSLHLRVRHHLSRTAASSGSCSRRSTPTSRRRSETSSSRSSCGRAHRSPQSAPSAACMSRPTSRSPASSAVSSCPRASTRITGESSSTSTSTGPSTSLNNVGAQLGYRRFEVNYKVETDEGELQIKGPYVGGVVRF